MDTIYALASGQGRAGVAVIRVSGAASLDSLRALTGRESFEPRKAYFLKISDPVSRETLDEALVIYFKSSASYTGEDVVEYHVHGGRAVVDSVLKSLSEQKLHRLALPGEFTRRAFENGKMDLTAAEAVADLIDAETAAQKMQALSQLSGGLSEIYHDWTERLKNILAHLEAEIEFPDEDLPEDLSEKFSPEIINLQKEISEHLNDNRRGERLRDGIKIAVVGAPNAGKSSLVNALARRDVAIVSSIAGTTRDVIEVHLDIDGYPAILSDTAGLRPEQLGNSDHDKIESEGIARALKRAQEADLKLLVFDGSAAPDEATMALKDDASLCVYNKADLASSDAEGINISAQSGAGLNDLLAALSVKIQSLLGTGETQSLTRARHREALENVVSALSRSCNAPLPELMADDLRLAIRGLGSITGKVDVEDLLDVIFNDFCIGK